MISNAASRNAWSGIIELTAARVSARGRLSFSEWMAAAEPVKRKEMIGFHFDSLVKEVTRRYLSPQLKELAAAANEEAIFEERRNKRRLLAIIAVIALIYGCAWMLGRIFLSAAENLDFGEVALISLAALAFGLPVSFYYAYRFHKRSTALRLTAGIFELAGERKAPGKKHQ